MNSKTISFINYILFEILVICVNNVFQAKFHKIKDFITLNSFMFSYLKFIK